MRCRKLIYLLATTFSAWTLLGADHATKLSEAEARALVSYAPKPAYPYDARTRHIQGFGTAILTIDLATGTVTNAVMAPSTGAKILDDEAIATFRRWRFKPGTTAMVRIPIAFFLSNSGGPVIRLEKMRSMGRTLAPFLGSGNVINAPIPHYPPYAMGASRQGSGVYEIHVNNRGTVSEVKILKSSGDPIFDQATVNALRQWKLRSGPKIIELPLAFRLTPDSYSVRIP